MWSGSDVMILHRNPAHLLAVRVRALNRRAIGSRRSRVLRIAALRALPCWFAELQPKHCSAESLLKFLGDVPTFRACLLEDKIIVAALFEGLQRLDGLSLQRFRFLVLGLVLRCLRIEHAVVQVNLLPPNVHGLSDS